MITNRYICSEDFIAEQFRNIAIKLHLNIINSAIYRGLIKGPMQQPNGDRWYRNALKGNLGFAFFNIDNTNMIKEEYRTIVSTRGVLLSHSSISDSKHPMNKMGYILIDINNTNYEVDISDHIFKHLQVNDRREIGKGSNVRYKDSEAKIIEYLAKVLDENQNPTGELVLYTDREPCLSCEYNLVEFVRKFKGIELTLYYNDTYNIV